MSDGMAARAVVQERRAGEMAARRTWVRRKVGAVAKARAALDCIQGLQMQAAKFQRFGKKRTDDKR